MTILELIKDFINAFTYFIKSNLRKFALILNIVLPYLMYAIGQYVYSVRGRVETGGEIAIPLVVCIITYFLRAYANKIGKGTTIPVPQERFTEVDDEGEVSIDHDRVQELILYVADLEDWMNRKGLL